MGTFLKILVAVGVLGIAAVVGTVILLDSTPKSAPAPAATPPDTSILIVETTPELTATPESEPTGIEQPTGDTLSPALWIKELTAECDMSEDFAVSDLPLGADWRTTERGVYSGSPVRITCVTGGSTDELSFEWSADVGEVQGSGDSIVWVAPGHGAKAGVTVVLQDSSGRKESATLNFRVATCECVFLRY